MRTLCTLLLSSILAQNAWGLDPNLCKNASSNGQIVQNINSQQKISTISHSEALRHFNELKNPRYKIPYLAAQDHCDLRGHKISQILYNDHKISTIKVFVEAINEEFYGAGAPSFTRNQFADDGTRINFTANDIIGQQHTWGYHTAPALCVSKNGVDELYIFDLSLFNEPVPYNVWKQKIVGNLGPEHYRSFSTNMYQVSRGSEYTPAKTKFETWETNMMNEALGADWRHHQRLLNGGPAESLATTPNFGSSFESLSSGGLY